MFKFAASSVRTTARTAALLFLLASCANEEQINPAPVSPASAGRLSSINIPVPTNLQGFLGPYKINSLQLKISPTTCENGTTGTVIEKFFPNFGIGSGSLANEKIKRGCSYELGISLGKVNGNQNGFEKIYLTNDTDALRTRIQLVDTKQDSIQTTVRVYPTQDGKKFLGLPGDAIDMTSNNNLSGSDIDNHLPTIPSPIEQQLPLNWKVVLMAADQGNQAAWIPAFDNARQKLLSFFESRGVPATNIRQLSLKPQFQNQSVWPTTSQNFSHVVQNLNAHGNNDACLIHMTSHGSRDGFNIGSSRLSPGELGAALDAGCGDRPTVVLISACFSGLYVLDSSGLKKPNRVILTAASSDRTSFGCSAEHQYTYWDSCLIENLPRSGKFRDLATNIQACIASKEAGVSTPSLPQTFIGYGVENLPLPGNF